MQLRQQATAKLIRLDFQDGRHEQISYVAYKNAFQIQCVMGVVVIIVYAGSFQIENRLNTKMIGAVSHYTLGVSYSSDRDSRTIYCQTFNKIVIKTVIQGKKQTGGQGSHWLIKSRTILHLCVTCIS